MVLFALRVWEGGRGMQQLLLLLLVAASTRAGAAEFLEQRARPDALRARGSRADNPNIITSQEKAEEVLKRYGYLQCGSRRRRNRHRGGGRDHDESWAGPRSCSAHELRKAVRLYQRNYSMPETGLLDPATLRVMSESRCGNPDIEAGALPQRSARRRKHERRKARGRGKRQAKPRRVNPPSAGSPRSEPTDLPAGRGATTAVARSSHATQTRRRRWLRDYVHRIETGQADRRACLVHSLVQSRRRNKRSVAPGFRIHIFAKEVVTWRLIGSAFSNQLTAATQRAAIALAFRMWGEVIPVMFEEDLRSAVDDVDILVAFGRGWCSLADICVTDAFSAVCRAADG
ncbi:matrix metalloproteinase-21-like [Ixodes scapularis]|uniref:matrix metalloproteinase-21-like n=1 Tax=Ixodes scapularis TaxID=6945 RepID=UPI001C395114|nr:matrix metalloproteinase-21-like [Ixodes scapularis]